MNVLAAAWKTTRYKSLWSSYAAHTNDHVVTWRRGVDWRGGHGGEEDTEERITETGDH